MTENTVTVMVEDELKVIVIGTDEGITTEELVTRALGEADVLGPNTEYELKIRRGGQQLPPVSSGGFRVLAGDRVAVGVKYNNG